MSSTPPTEEEIMSQLSVAIQELIEDGDLSNVSQFQAPEEV